MKNRFNFISIFFFLCYNYFGDKMKKAKLSSQKKTNSMISTDNEMSKLIILILVVALVFALFYVITLFVTKKDSGSTTNEGENDTQVSIQYEKILASNIFTQKNNEYYVLVYFSDDNYLDLYKSYLSYYRTSIEGAVPYYLVDMSDVFNKSFIAEKSNLNVSNIKELKFSQTALLRLRDNKIISTYEGNEQITGKLGRMTK